MNDKKFVFDKLIEYGFTHTQDIYSYTTTLPICKFVLTIEISTDNSLKTTLVDPVLDEEYVLHLNPKSSGKFVGTVKGEYQKVLDEIVAKCTLQDGFVTKQANLIVQYAKDKYKSEIEFLWKDKFKSSDGVLRRNDTSKWYAALLTCSTATLKGKGEGNLEVINLRIAPEKLDAIVDNQKYFRAYHMNKKRWLSIVLDSGVSIEEIYQRLDESYLSAI